MKTLTKGALAMVLAGSVTFSVTNALLVEPSSKRVTEENALTVTGDQNEGDKITKAEKTVNDQTPTTNVQENETKISDDIPASQVTFKNRNQNDRAVDSIQQNTKKSSKPIATNMASINKTTTTTSTATTTRTTSIKAPTTTTASKPSGTTETSVATKPAPVTKPAISTNTPATTTTSAPGTNTTKNNRGQEVSQAAKEKGASNRDKKENNGKNM